MDVGFHFALFNPQTPHQTELNLASYGINRYSVVPLITAAALGTTILGKLFSVGFHHFYSLSDESIVRETEKLLNDLDISEKDRETLGKRYDSSMESFDQHDSAFFSDRLDELFDRFEDPSADKQLALQEFQEAIRSS